MKVLVTIPNLDIRTSDHRIRIAKLASRIVEARAEPACETQGLPYMPNDGDTLFWTLDAGNDWKIKFSDGNKDTFEVIHRYQINDRERAHEPNTVNEAVKSLGGWLAYRLGGTMIVDMGLAPVAA